MYSKDNLSKLELLHSRSSVTGPTFRQVRPAPIRCQCLAFVVPESEAGQMFCREKPCGGGGLPATVVLLGNGFAGLGEVKTAPSA
jgi:hypothetical protein